MNTSIKKSKRQDVVATRIYEYRCPQGWTRANGFGTVYEVFVLTEEGKVISIGTFDNYDDAKANASKF